MVIQESAGGLNERNAAWHEASTSLITFLDADDELTIGYVNFADRAPLLASSLSLRLHEHASQVDFFIRVEMVKP